MPDPIEAAMLENGERLVVGANHPIVLSGNDAVYVRVGALDLFVQLVTATTVGNVTTTLTPTGTIALDTGTGSHQNEYTVQLTGVPNASHLSVTLHGVTDSVPNGPADISQNMDVLLGDVDATGSVSGSDVNRVKAQVGASLTSANYKDDVDLTGSVSGSDVNKTKSVVGSNINF